MKEGNFKTYAATLIENNGYTKNRPLCKKCTLHYTGPCTVKCNTCNKVGHLTKNCRNKGPATRSIWLLVNSSCRDVDVRRALCKSVPKDRQQQCPGKSLHAKIHAHVLPRLQLQKRSFSVELDIFNQ
ncbi:reverse transcriptase domain-containing protein [Tanacetum coccineum]